MHYIYILFITLTFFGCSQKEVVKPEISTVEVKEVVQDLVEIPQEIRYYTKNLKGSLCYSTQEGYEKIYFGMWNLEKAPKTLKDVEWSFRVFNTEKNYTENYQPVQKNFFKKMFEQSNFDNYSSVNKKGLTLNYTNIRAFPTTRPLLLDPSLAGEGFPFDYLQNSSINSNVPIFISHYSKDKQWVFIFSNLSYGWIKSKDIVEIDEKYTSIWKNAKQVYITKEGIPLFTTDGIALFNTRVGMLFSLIDEDADSYTILCVTSCKNNKPMFNKVVISKEIATTKILTFNNINIDKIITEISKTNYGWGGLFEQRDCSSMLMDYFIPFGIHLPRNSSMQSSVGEVINLSTLEDADKINLIKKRAVPFQTLLYKKGHIMLYVGTYKNEIIIFHNTWGIKTKDNQKEGRFIIGKPIFSTLRVGGNLKNYDKSAELLKNIESMNIITR